MSPLQSEKVLRSTARPKADGKLKNLQINWIFLGISFIVALVARSCRSYVVLPWENINCEPPRLFRLTSYEQRQKYGHLNIFGEKLT